MRKITPHVLARWLEIDARTVLKWVHTGQLPEMNISTGDVPRFVIYRRDAVAFLRKRGLTHQQLVSFGLEPESSLAK